MKKSFFILMAILSSACTSYVIDGILYYQIPDPLEYALAVLLLITTVTYIVLAIKEHK